ncbi:MAG: hypothetical protein DCC57_19350 [Chloroflexi bacterium]|nr:MAG: hypothetical protein DCC57_19350 [Chloroflexota bacterium]
MASFVLYSTHCTRGGTLAPNAPSGARRAVPDFSPPQRLLQCQRLRSCLSSLERPWSMQNPRRLNIPTRAVITGLGIFVLLLLVFGFASNFFYFFERVDEDEVGVQFVSGRIKNVVGPGVYSDAGLFVEMRRVSSQAVAFSVSDAELITRDKQRIGLVVTGDIFASKTAPARP